MMKKAVPIPVRPRHFAEAPKIEEWQRRIDNYDRSERRRESRYRERVVRLSQVAVGLIHSDRTVDLSELNRLGPTREASGTSRFRARFTSAGEGTGNVALPATTD
jgi:hypothetical protein